MRDAQRHAAAGRDHVEIAVAVVVAHERQRLAVGAEPRKRLRPRRAGERHGDAAGPRNEPDVVGINERDVGGADVGEAQHARVGSDVGGGERNQPAGDAERGE